MDSLHCKDEEYCPGGNCPGCRDGKRWCKDPRCAPDCQDCPYPEERDRLIAMVMFLILICLFIILIIYLIGYGHTFNYMYVPDHNNPYYNEALRFENNDY